MTSFVSSSFEDGSGAKHSRYQRCIRHVLSLDRIDRSSVQQGLGCSQVQQILISELCLPMHVHGAGSWIEGSPLFLITGHKQTLNVAIIGCWNDLADII